MILVSAHSDTEFAILDGAIVLNFLKPVSAKTLNDHGVKVFLLYIESRLYNVSRVDIFWDQYIMNSLKYQTRNKHSKALEEE